MTSKGLEKERKDLIDVQATALHAAEEARRNHTRDLIEVMDAEEDLNQITFDLTMEIIKEILPEELVDPRTGKQNAGWADAVTKSKVQTNPKYVVAVERAKAARASKAKSETEMYIAAETLGAINHQMRVLASAMNLEAGGG